METRSARSYSSHTDVIYEFKRMIRIDKKFICPISHQVMLEPITVKDIHYDAEAYRILTAHLKNHSEQEEVIANIDLKEDINHFLEHWYQHIDKLNRLKFGNRLYLCQTPQIFFKIAANPAIDFKDMFYLETFLSAIDQFGRNALQIAALAGNAVFITFVLTENKDFNLNHPDFSGQTLLHHSAIGKIKNEELLKLFLHVIKPTQDKFGNSPLHYAAQHDNDVMVHLLCEQGADTQCENAEGKRAIQLADPHSTSYAILLDPIENQYETNHEVLCEYNDTYEKDNKILSLENKKLRSEVKTLQRLNNELLQHIHDMNTNKLTQVVQETPVSAARIPSPIKLRDSKISRVVSESIDKIKFNIFSKNLENINAIELIEKANRRIAPEQPPPLHYDTQSDCEDNIKKLKSSV